MTVLFAGIAVVGWLVLLLFAIALVSVSDAKGPLRRERPRSVSNVRLVRDEDDAA